MASHFKWYPESTEAVVPFNARFSFPSQANKAIKMTPRIPPKNGAEFSPGSVIRLEFPAQGYVNPGKTTLEFDVIINYTPGADDRCAIRFQNNIQSIFNRVRFLYGATPLEDIPNYNVIVRSLTEWCGTSQQGVFDQTSINEGIGGVTQGVSGRKKFAYTDGTTATYLQPSTVNVRQNYIHGYNMSVGQDDLDPDVGQDGCGVVPNATVSATVSGHDTHTGNNPQRRYQVQLALGIMNQEKLIPTKFMASQLAIEITLANPAECMYVRGTPLGGAPTYTVKNVNIIPEILEFDASYDESFLRGLQTGGVPLKFSTWNHYQFSNSQASSVNLQIQERSRSVKALFALQRRGQANFEYDSGATFFNTHSDQTTNFGTLKGVGSSFQSYQYRIGGRYFPAQPVQCTTEVGGQINNGGAEAWLEMAKALNILGDYRLSSSCNTARWAVNPGGDLAHGTITAETAIPLTFLSEYDYDYSLVQFTSQGAPLVTVINGSNNGTSGTLGSSMFGMAIDLETSNGLEISGLNAEEQSDISLIARFSHAQAANFNYDVFTYIDSMIVLRENNVLELIQ